MQEFRTLALSTGAGWIAGTLLADLGARQRFRATRWEIVPVALAALGLYALTALAALPWSLGLAGMIALTLAALARGRGGRGEDAELLARLAPPPPRAAYLAMPLLPLAAVLTYPVVHANRIAVPTEDIVFALLLAGALAFLWALARSLRAGRRSGAGKEGS